MTEPRSERALVSARLFPALVGWNRLEGRPRTPKIDKALKAEVRDALWMLTRQWQMGEFRGDDAGSPILATSVLDNTRLSGYRAGQPGAMAEAFESELPLEARVEMLPAALRRSNKPIALDVRLAMGRYWLKLIAGIGNFESFYLQRYKVTSPPASSVTAADAGVAAHPAVWQSFAAAAGRLMDGGDLYLFLAANPANVASDGLTGATPAQRTSIDAAGKRFVEWFQRSFPQPVAGGPSAYAPSRLEYSFVCAAETDATSKVFTADEYATGHLDWYNLDVDTAAGRLAAAGAGLPPKPERQVSTSIPAPLTFPGMPDTRWWAFEDGQTNLGDIDVATTDLGKLLFLEFCLVYANDWYMQPITLPEGSVASLRGIAVTNVFGERFFIEPAGAASGGAWDGWTMFTASAKGGDTRADTDLTVLPVARRVLSSVPQDDLLLLRDEMANMVWGVEASVPMADGSVRPGPEAGVQTRAFFERLAGPAPAPAKPTAPIRYTAMVSPPEHWIPFVPTHVDGSNREIQLQRGALPRLLDGDHDERPRKITPRTVLLRAGLDQTTPGPYFLFEEEVPRAGIRVTRTYQRTRWRNGRTMVWLGVKKETGRGEGSSGLAFDQIDPQAQPTEPTA